MARVRVSGFIIVFNRIPALIAAVEANSQTAPKRVADRVAATAQQIAPKDTGYLASSIHAESVARGKTAEVRVDADYAAYVEYGTYKMAAQPFLQPAVSRHAAEFAAEVAKPLGGSF